MYIGGATNKLSEAQLETVSGKRIRKPSDDVPGTSRSMSLRSVLSDTDQFMNNIEVARPQLEVSMGATHDMVQLIQKVRDIAIEGAKPDYTGGMQRDTLQAELDNIMDQMYDLANTKHGDGFVFAGTMTDTKPVTLNGAPPPPYQYDGNTETKTVRVLQWVDLPVNVPGEQLFNFDHSAGATTTDVFEMVTNLRAALDTGNPSTVSSELDNIDANLKNTLSYEARMGSWYARMDDAYNVLEESKLRFQEMLSDNEDVDLSEAIVNLKTQENVYQSALMITTRMLDLSLSSSQYF